MKKISVILCAVLALIFLIFQSGCISYRKNITRRSELSNPSKINEMTIMAKNKTIYRFRNFFLRDSSIVGAGSFDDGNKEVPFKGEVNFSDIDYVQVRRFSIMRGVLLAVPVSIFAGTVLHYFGSKKDGLSITEVVSQHYPPAIAGGSSGSCPFIYSWNGHQYVLDGEAFATAWGKALEMNSQTVLPSLREVNGKLRIRITNERPETHYINALHLVAVETDGKTEVAADAFGGLWPVSSLKSPFQASDHSGHSVVKQITAKDENYWESNIVSAAELSKFEDEINITFLKPASHGEASLVIRAINTKLFNAVMKVLSDYLGDESLAFVHALEHDPEMIAIMKQWLDESSLKAFLWNGSEWQQIGSVLAEANEVPFTRVIRFDAADVPGYEVKIRLTGLSDVWKLDAAQVDWSSVQSLKAEPVKMISALRPGHEDVSAAIEDIDNNYTVILPSEQIDLEFKAPSLTPGKQLVYALNTEGYMHEWFPEAENKSGMKMVRYLNSESKIEFLKYLLQHKSLFLPTVYNEWRFMKK